MNSKFPSLLGTGDDEQIRRARRRALTHLRQERDRYHQLALKEASDALQRAEWLRDNPSSDHRFGYLTLRQAESTTRPVLASFGLNAPMFLELTSKPRPSAWTDFQTIRVQLPISDFGGETTDVEEIVRRLAIAKGLIYHEAGHLLYSNTFESLLGMAAAEGAELPDGLLEDMEQFFFLSWVMNILDDQRMECALVRVSPVFENHLRITVAYMILEPAIRSGRISMNWPLICGRTFIPKDVLHSIRTKALFDASQRGLSSEFRVIEASVRAYKKATTATEMVEAILIAAPAFRSWFTPEDIHRVPTIGMRSDNSSARPKASRPELNASATQDQSGDIDDEGEDPVEMDLVPDEQAEIQNMIDELLAGEIERSTPTDEGAEVVTNMAEAASRGVPKDRTVKPMTNEQVDWTMQVRAGMLDVLSPLVTEADPSWRFRCESGVLDPVAYHLREPGETDYWTSLVAPVSPGYDLAVSLLLDISGSMNTQLIELSVAACGIRLACNELDIPCTVSTFSDDHALLFNVDDPTELVTVDCGGGTQPLSALEDIKHQRVGKSRHLVVVFTDGLWEGVPTLDQFRYPGLFVLGVTLDARTEEELDARRFDRVVKVQQAISLADECSRDLASAFLRSPV